MSGTLPGADVRGFYQALGIELPGWARRDASVACFSDPDAHAHGDRDPSCSVNVETGAWRCWGCGARGGAYDAALARGRAPRDAIDLMITHALTTRRATSGSTTPHRPPDSAGGQPTAARSADRDRARLGMSEHELAEARARLTRLIWPPRLLRPAQRRLWSRAALLELGCGWERGRVLIPIRNTDHELRGVLGYAPTHDRAPKMLAVPGTQLGLLPHPAAEPSEYVVLLEGPPDMITARSQGLPAIAVPGDHAWDPAWAQFLVGRRVFIVMDCDRAGRQAAQRIAADLTIAGIRRSVVDLAPHRHDGYDLTDWLANPDRVGADQLAAITTRAGARVSERQH